MRDDLDAEIKEPKVGLHMCGWNCGLISPYFSVFLDSDMLLSEDLLILAVRPNHGCHG
jgi:hypothetical protein